MVKIAPVHDSLDAVRPTTLYEWAFAITVGNFIIQLYKLLAEVTTLAFDLLKLNYAFDLFWPMTTDDLRPYNQYFQFKNEILVRIGENLVLTIVGFLCVLGLLKYDVVLLFFMLFVLIIHTMALMFGIIFLNGRGRVRYASMEFIFWLAGFLFQVMVVIILIALLSYAGKLIGLT